MTSCYNTDIEGWYTLLHHDGRSPLERWFSNYIVEPRQYSFAARHEWLTLKPVYFASTRGRQHRYWVGEIGPWNSTEPTRSMRFEVDAPEPPLLFKPAQEPYRQGPFHRFPYSDRSPVSRMAAQRAAVFADLALNLAKMQAMIETIPSLPCLDTDLIRRAFHQPLRVTLFDTPPPKPKIRRNS